MLQIDERVVNGVTILDLKGKITLGEGDELLKKRDQFADPAGQEEAAAQPRRRPLHR